MCNFYTTFERLNLQFCTKCRLFEQIFNTISHFGCKMKKIIVRKWKFQEVLAKVCKIFITFVAKKEKPDRFMDVKDFFGKIFSPYLLGHLAAMIIVVVALCLGVRYGLAVYTHHGEGIELPNLYGMNYEDAIAQLGSDGIYVVASDTGYNKKMDANAILMQTPGAGTKVKEGRTIYVTINSTSSPKVKIPDIIDNSSFREAQARLTAIGFRLLEPSLIDGERDWVYGVMAGTKSLQTGDVISIETPLTLVIGSGKQGEEDEEDMMLDVPDQIDDEIDTFEEVTE